MKYELKLKRYRQLKIIGHGSYAKVYEGIDNIYKKKIAIKSSYIPSSEGIPISTLREINVLKTISHDNIVKLIDVFSTEREMFLVLEYFEYDLKKYTKNVIGYDYLNIFKQITDGLYYIHHKQIIHRDLKPQNILVNSKGRAVITDFGLSRTMEIEINDYEPEVVSLWYRSPELLNGQTNYSYHIDIWSLGCIFYEVLSGEVLFPGTNIFNQLNLLKSQNEYFYFLEKKLISLKIKQNVITAVLGCLIKSTKKRINVLKIKEILSIEN